MGEPHRHLQRLGLLAAAFGHVEPFVRKRAAHAVQDFFGDEIADGAFHHAPGGRGGDIDELLRVKQLLKLGLDGGVKVFEPLAAMADHRLAKRLEGFLAHLDRSRYVQFDVCHKFVEIFHDPRCKGKRSFANCSTKIGNWQIGRQFISSHTRSRGTTRRLRPTPVSPAFAAGRVREWPWPD